MSRCSVRSTDGSNRVVRSTCPGGHLQATCLRRRHLGACSIKWLTTAWQLPPLGGPLVRTNAEARGAADEMVKIRPARLSTDSFAVRRFSRASGSPFDARLNAGLTYSHPTAA